MVDNGRIKITVVETGNQVRIGVEAPKDMLIDREEVFRRKQGEDNE